MSILSDDILEDPNQFSKYFSDLENIQFIDTEEKDHNEVNFLKKINFALNKRVIIRNSFKVENIIQTVSRYVVLNSNNNLILFLRI